MNDITRKKPPSPNPKPTLREIGEQATRWGLEYTKAGNTECAVAAAILSTLVFCLMQSPEEQRKIMEETYRSLLPPKRRSRPRRTK